MTPVDTSHYPIVSRPRTLKVVFSNLPALLNGLRYRIFPPGDAIEWYPENTMTLEQVNDMASGRFSTQPGIIVTNSPLVIKAFKLHGDHNPRAVSFFCVQWVLNEQKETDGEYVIYASNKLDCIPCPPLGWEDMQTQDIHRARHHSQPIPSYAETLENQP